MVALAHHLQHHFATHARRVAELAPAALRDEPDAVHQMRVATRRLRALLRVFADRFEPLAGHALGSELAWLGTTLGRARDVEVLRDLIGPELAGTALADQLAERHRQAFAEVGATLDSARYARLVADLAQFADLPPWSAAADEPEREARRSVLAHESARVAHRMARADAVSLADREEYLHEVRKAARRARYAAEACRGAQAAATASRMEAVQDALGTHRDAMLPVAIIDGSPDMRLAAARQRLLHAADSAIAGYDGMQFSG